MSFPSVNINAETVLRFPGGKLVAPATEPLRPVLIVLHQESSTPGRVGNALRVLGHRLDIRRPRFGDPLPETLEGHAGAVIFGGPMSANDPDDFVRREIDWIAVPLREQRPFLGICPAGRAVCPGWPDHVYHWHREGFELPAGAEVLAEGSYFPVEAFRFDHAFGFQFHPDVTYAMMHRWTTRGHARLELPGARPRHHHFADRAVHDVTERAWLKRFLDGWLARLPSVAMSEAAE
jgi:GMP synthase (glutamine-hydrolysing)